MDIRKLQRAIVDGLEDVKAHHIVVFNTEHLSPLFERVIIATGTSNRQTKSLASSVRDAVKERGFPVLRTEGEANGEWIIVDCGAAVVHLMQPSIREYYHLEEIWGEKPVHMKLGSKPGETRLVKAEEPADERGSNASKRKATATPKKAKAKPASGRVVRAKAPAPAGRGRAAPADPMSKTTAGARRKAAGPPGKPSVGTRSKAPAKGAGVITRTVGVKRAAAKVPVASGPAGKGTAKRPPATRTVTTRPPAGRVPAKRSTTATTVGKAPMRKAAAKKSGSRS